MKRPLLRVLLLSCALVLPLATRAQGETALTLDETLRRVEKGNAALRVADVEHRISQAQFRQTDAIFLPQVSVSYNAMLTNNPLNAFGFLLQQSGVTMASFNPATLNHPSATDHYTTSLDVKMPLFNLDMMYARRGAKAMERVARHKAAYTLDNLQFEAQKAYTQLQFAHRAKAVLQQTLADVKAIRQTVANFEAQGLAQRSDVLNADLQVSTIETALAKAQSNIANASEGLAMLMGMEATEGIVFRPDSLSQLQATADGEFTAQRADVQAMLAGLEATHQMARSAKAAFVPKINAFGSYQLNNGKPLAFKNDSYMVGINLTWNVFQGSQHRHKAKEALLQATKMQDELRLHVDRSRVEVEKLKRDLLDFAYEIRQQQTGVAQAEEALRIIRDRHKEGLASTTDLLQAQAQLSQQQLGLAQTIMHHNIAQYQQQLLTSTHE